MAALFLMLQGAPSCLPCGGSVLCPTPVLRVPLSTSSGTCCFDVGMFPSQFVRSGSHGGHILPCLKWLSPCRLPQGISLQDLLSQLGRPFKEYELWALSHACLSALRTHHWHPGDTRSAVSSSVMWAVSMP